MLGLSSAGTRLAAFGVVVATIATIIGLAYHHYQGLVSDNAALHGQLSQLAAALEEQRAAVADSRRAVGEWAEAQRRQEETLRALATAQRAAADESRRLNALLARHDLARLAEAKPVLVERRINAAAADARRLLELATGADRPDAGRAAPPAVDAGAPAARPGVPGAGGVQGPDGRDGPRAP